MEILITGITVLLNLVLGLFTFLKNPKSDTNRYFLLLTIICSSWALANYFSLHSESEYWTLFWIRAVMVINSPLSPVIYLFISAFPHATTGIPRIKLLFIYIFVFVTAVLSASPYLFTSVTIENGVISPTPGIAMPIYAINFLGFLILSFYVLIKKYRSAKGLVKVQLRYLVFGIILTFTLIAFSSFISVVVFRVSDFVILGPVYTLIFIGFIAYSVVKHRFLDLKVLIFRSVFYALLVLLMTVLYIVFLTVFVIWVSGVSLTTANILSLSAGTAIAILAYRPIEHFFHEAFGWIFLKNAYNMNDFLQRVSVLMTSTINLRELLEHFSKIMYSEMNVTKLYLVIAKEGEGVWYHTFRYEKDQFKMDELLRFSKKMMKSNHEHIFIFEELGESDEKQFMRENDISVLIPLTIKKELVGTLVLADKGSGEIYSSQDIEALQIVAPQLAIAVRNAFSYAEIQRFNVTLKEEVDNATLHLKRANRRLREIDKLKDEFISIASHELRTPMTAIKNYLWLVLNDPKNPIPETARKNLDVCFQSTDRLIKLVNEMLTVSRIEGNRIALNKTVFPIADLIHQVCDELAAVAQQKEVRFSCEYESVTGVIEGDKDKLKEVVINIVGNALKFTPVKGIVGIHSEILDKMVLIHVTDNGPGILKEDMEKLFTKFGKFDHAYKKLPNVNGTGLGLYISKQIIDLHGGDITVQSEVNKGTTFTIHLPIQKGGAKE